MTSLAKRVLGLWGFGANDNTRQMWTIIGEGRERKSGKESKERKIKKEGKKEQRKKEGKKEQRKKERALLP